MLNAREPLEPPRSTDATHRVGEATRLASVSSLRMVDSVQDVDVFFDPAVNIVMFRQEQSQGNSAQLAEEWIQTGAARRMAVVSTNATHASIAALLGQSICAEHVHFWVELLGELTGCAEVGLRLERAASALCPAFHVDHVTVRLVTTLLGAGTECLANEYATGALGSVARTHAHVAHAQQGDIVLLKGTRWPNNAGHGALHRSPPVSDGTTRLVLTLDPLD
jgi:hypothetical protein